jgi:hypothetical protein
VLLMAILGPTAARIVEPVARALRRKAGRTGEAGAQDRIAGTSQNDEQRI